MASNGIRDRVAIVGMGCTPFGEHWDRGVDDLLVDASREALGSRCRGRSRSTTSR
jgi:acetyl-CoA C-acetyltransferase